MSYTFLRDGEQQLSELQKEQIKQNLGLDNLVGQATENGGEIFNNYYRNQAFGDGSHAEGIETLTGATGYDVFRVINLNQLVVQDTNAEVKAIDAYSKAINSDTYALAFQNIEYGGEDVYNLTIIAIDNDGTQSIITIAPSLPVECFNPDNGEGQMCWIWVYNKKNGGLLAGGYPPTDSYSAGYAAHAEGAETKAYNHYSHAEGLSSVALAAAAHAEGNSTRAYGVSSHTEGSLTYTANKAAHAEGYKTQAIGKYSHAEGNNSLANSEGSHAEGKSKALASYAHAEGESEAHAEYSHAEGINSITRGLAAHAEGEQTQANGHASHAEGQDCLATGEISHAEGDSTQSLRHASHSEGYNTRAKGNQSHAEGKNTVSKGANSHAEGEETLAGGIDSHAEGRLSQALGLNSHAEGQSTCVEENGRAGHAEGRSTVVRANYAHAEGRGTIAASEFQHVQGRYNIEDTDNKYAHIVGNGEAGSPSNAHTLGWNGNAWFKGDVYVGGSSETNATRLPRIYSGTTAPNNSLGNDGDIYIVFAD